MVEQVISHCLEPLKSVPDTELSIVDNNSIDDTIKKIHSALEGIPADRYTVRSGKYNRGEGRNAAARNSSGELLLFIDADVYAPNVERYIELYEKEYYGKVVRVHGDLSGSYYIIVDRDTFEKLEGFPELQHAEDRYLVTISRELGIFENLYEESIKPLLNRGMTTGNQKRYYRGPLNVLKGYIRSYSHRYWFFEGDRKQFFKAAPELNLPERYVMLILVWLYIRVNPIKFEHWKHRLKRISSRFRVDFL